MGAKHFLFSMILLFGLFVVGCRVTPPGELECAPPAVKMLDVNGNPVCVMPEIAEENVTALEEEEGMPAEEEEVPIEEVIPPEEEVSPITGEVIAPPEEIEVEELPTKEVTEGDLVSFPNLAATDADGDPVTYTFTEPLNEQGEWQTDIGDAGEYRVTITASDGISEVSQDVLILVRSANQPPLLESIQDITVNEGEIVSFDPVVSDPEGDEITITYSGWMTQSTYRTNFEDAGEYLVTVTATDGVNTVSQDVRVTVADLNRPPVLAPIADVTVTEGEDVLIEPTATDPDGDLVEITFSEPLDEEGSWETASGDAGTYEIDVTASDGVSTDTRSFRITVRSLNQPPKFVEMPTEIKVSVSKTKTATVTLSPVVTDPDGDDVTITYAGWMTRDTKVATVNDAHHL